MPEQTFNPTPGEPDPMSRGNGSLLDQPAEMDAANASLAGALSVSFAVLRIVMVLLIVVFLFSGFFTVAPDEVAVRTRFGKIISGPEGEVLSPEGGPYFRWPAPVGQVYRIPTVTIPLAIDKAFVFRAAINSGQALNEISQGERLQPEYDGSLLTADKSIVHARYQVQYKILPEDAAQFVRNVASVADLNTAVDPRMLIFREADRLVSNAVEQAIVEDVAATPLDRFLQGGRAQRSQAPTTAPAAGDDAADQPPVGEQPDATPVEPVAGDQTPPPGEGGDDHEGEDHEGEGLPPAGEQEDQIRVRAQEVLDRLGSGITIQSVSRTEQAVVSIVRNAMTLVAQQQAIADQMLNQATTFRNNTLVVSAGAAYPAVLAVIDVYEEAYRLRESNPEFFETTRQAVQDTFLGEPLGPILTGLADALPPESQQGDRLRSMARTYANARIEGSAGNLVRNASSRASSYVAALESDAQYFEKMLATYRQTPEFTRRSLFAQTLSAIFGSDGVETSFISPGSELRLRLNREREQQLEDEQRGREQRGEARGEARPPNQ